MVVPSLAYDVGGTGPLLLQSWSVKCISSNHSACLLHHTPQQHVSHTPAGREAGQAQEPGDPSWSVLRGRT
eukprot:COSAG04_NODE_169_length_21636_cov_32.919023_1_plen_71_part_00